MNFASTLASNQKFRLGSAAAVAKASPTALVNFMMGKMTPADSGGMFGDLLAVSGGFSPVVHLHAQAGGRPRWDETACCFVPGPPVQAERSAGACNGSLPLGDALAQGWNAGHEAASAAGLSAAAVGTRAPATEPEGGRVEPLAALWQVPWPARAAKAFVDFQNDVTAAAQCLRGGWE